ncbi:Metallo-dependent phosphatase [Ascobolus immersus RN42]|uniref:Metallo-dependent phosphatase n=1 Tax=Ascobolus immersus RN42 TaxID=1160509 RepID=A0A3N4HLY7_ASCIM|nr:Metallo-dependent phosphatase [Ascobolus immersus RN42]
MARKIVRTILQSLVFLCLLLLTIFLLDTRYLPGRLLPTSLHNRLPQHHHHHPGYLITDITVVTCGKLLGTTPCSLKAGSIGGGTGSKTAVSGEGESDWIRIEKDIYLKESWVTQGYVFFRRIKEEEYEPSDDPKKGVRVVVEVRAGGKNKPEDSPEGGVWESRPGGLWIRLARKVTSEAVTAVDLLFGPDAVDPRPGWTLDSRSLDFGELDPRITIRRGDPTEMKIVRPVVRMNKDGKLKILQVSDMHLSTGLGKCRDAEPEETRNGCEADPRTLEFVERMIDEEQASLVVLSGDMVNGETANDVQTAIFKFADLLIRKKIPYAAILGNHDNEGNLRREQVIDIIRSLPYSLTERGPDLGPVDANGENAGGYGNYVVEVLASKSDHSAVSLWMFDTHGYSPDKKQFRGYNWVQESQINWFKKEFEARKEAHSKYSYIHLDLAFIHIPLPEYRTNTNPILGQWLERVTAPSYNSGFRTVLSQKGVRIVSAGHDHANDFCMLDGQTANDKIWMCYAGASGFGGYGGYGGLQRKVRVWEVDGPLGRVRSWKRLEWPRGSKERVDDQVLMDGGHLNGG